MMLFTLALLLGTSLGNGGGYLHPHLIAKLNTLQKDASIQVIVHMKNQPDLLILPERTSKDEKIFYLQQFAATDQNSILNYLKSLGNRVLEVKAYWIFNGLTLKATPDIIVQIASRQDVEYVIDDLQFRIHEDIIKPGDGLRAAEWNIIRVKAPDCWNLGYNGTGIIVGNIDTGVNITHPALAGKWISGGWFDAVNGEPAPYDDNLPFRHGTATMAVICGGDGNGPFVDDIGVAPGAHFICAKGCDWEGNAYATDLHDCLQWFASQNADVLNNSWGGEEDPAEFWNDCLNLYNLGIYTVCSIGNEGEQNPPYHWYTACEPANYPCVTGVGASDIGDTVVCWSSRGPAPNGPPWNQTQYWQRPDWNLIKPDIAAPGANVRSTGAGTGYRYWYGTSFSAPHVTGAVALCLQKYPNFSPKIIYNILLNTAVDTVPGVTYPNNIYGWGRLNCYEVLTHLPFQPDNQIKNWWESTYLGDDVYDSTGYSQYILQITDPNQWAVYHIKIENDGAIFDSIRIKATTAGTGTWTVVYYDALSGGNNITNQITSPNGWCPGITNAGSARYVRVEVKPGSGMNGLVKIVKITSRSQYTILGEKIDVVRMDTQCNHLQPDNQIKNSSESIYIGNNIYNTNGYNQTKNQDTQRGQKAIYHVKVQNDGETWDVAVITGPGSDTYWTIAYFDALTGGTNITTGVVNGTYWTYLQNPQDVKYFRVEVTPTSQCPWGTQKEVLITTTSGYNANKKDAVKAITKNTLIEINPPGSEAPISESFYVKNIYPNPCQEVIGIKLHSPDEREINIEIYDALGELVKTIPRAKVAVGVNDIVIVPKDLAAGVYFIRIDAAEYEYTGRFIILK